MLWVTGAEITYFTTETAQRGEKYRNLMEKGKPEYNCGLSHEQSPKYGFWK